MIIHYLYSVLHRRKCETRGKPGVWGPEWGLGAGPADTGEQFGCLACQQELKCAEARGAFTQGCQCEVIKKAELQFVVSLCV